MTYAQSMILAAGKGTRMGAISDSLPKPLVPVNGTPMIDRALAQIGRARLFPTVVNVHHLADRLEEHLAPYIADGRVIISDERGGLLETGGGVKKALHYADPDAPFTVINGDAIWLDGAEKALTRLRFDFGAHFMNICLLAVPTSQAMGYDGPGDLHLIESPDLQARKTLLRSDKPAAYHMFGGIMVVKPSLYMDTPDGPFSNRLLFERAAAEGQLYSTVHLGRWMHVGTPEGVRLAEDALIALEGDRR